jgi:methylisocitrate lyase
LTAFRAANKAAENVFRILRTEGTQSKIINELQTRDELYAYIDYQAYESKLDQLFSTDSDL